MMIRRGEIKWLMKHVDELEKSVNAYRYEIDLLWDRINYLMEEAGKDAKHIIRKTNKRK